MYASSAINNYYNDFRTLATREKLGALLSLSIGYAVYSVSYRHVTVHHTNLAFASAKAATAQINGDSIEDYLKNGRMPNMTALTPRCKS